MMKRSLKSKTILAGLLTIGGTVGAFLTGMMSPVEAGQTIAATTIAMCMRDTIAKAGGR